MKATSIKRGISRKEFKEIVKTYKPFSFETYDPNDPRFRKQINYLLKNEDRFWQTLKVALNFFPDGNLTVADLGAYPGTLLRLLNASVETGKLNMYGIGLMISEDFSEAITTDCNAQIIKVNLDPRNDQLRDKEYPTQIPLEDSSIDFIFALEIIEHLVSPTHLLCEAFRICKPGGHLLLTTPNVTRIGNVFKLAAGLSNYDRLVPPDYINPDDEWRPHFCEYTLSELNQYLLDAGFKTRYQTQSVMNDTRYGVKGLRQIIIDLLKIPFFLIPHFRDNLLVVAQKPSQ